MPLVAGIYWPRANALGGMAAMFAGLATWLLMEAFAADAPVPPQLAGVLASAAGMAIGSLWPTRTGEAGAAPKGA